MFYLSLGSNDLLCGKGSEARLRREAGNETTDTTPVVLENEKFPKNTMLRILNLTTTRINIRKVGNSTVL